MQPIRSYVVRIYRQEPSEATDVTGVVEDVETGLFRPFHSVVELWKAIGGSTKPPRAGRSAPRREKHAG
jgi:hypothetical protein